MSGNHVTELVKGRGEVVEQRPVLRGYISAFVGTSKGKQITTPSAFPIPGGEHNLAWVVTPEYSTVRPLGPCQWTAEHGSRLPKQFAKCVVSMDDEGIPTIVWWEGEQKEPEGGGGGTYSAGEGLELKEIVGKVFAIAPKGVLKTMLATAVQEEIEAAITEAGEGLEKSGKKLLIKALGVVTGMYAKESVTLEKLSSAVQTKLGEIKAYTAKAAGGLEVAGTEIGVEPEGITNAMIKAAAGIPESKLSTPEMVKLTGTQTITGAKTFTKGIIVSYPAPAETEEEKGTTPPTESLKVTGAAGGNTSFSGEGTAEGGAGAPFTIEAPIGGSATKGGTETEAVGGTGGRFVFRAGPGGPAAATSTTLTAKGGKGGPQIFTGGLGGTPTGTGSGPKVGGEGGPIEATGGLGGPVTSGTGTRTGGKGGPAILAGGPGGTGIGTGTIIGGEGGLGSLSGGKAGIGGASKAGNAEVKGGAASTDTLSGSIIFATGKSTETRMTITSEGAVKIAKGFAAWGEPAPTVRHAALTAPEVGLDKVLLEEIIAVLKEYGLTK